MWGIGLFHSIVMNLRKIFSFRTYIPRGIMGRTILLIVFPAVILQVVSAFLFFEKHWKNVNQNVLDTFIKDIDIVLLLLDKKIKPLNMSVQEFSDHYLNMNVKVLNNTIFRKKDNTYPYIAINSAKQVEDNFRKKFYGNYNLYFESNPSRIIVELPFKGNLVVIKTPARRLFSSSVGIFFIWSIFGTFISILVIVPFLKHQVKSIKNLATAADSFGKGFDVSYFHPSGATQIRRAGVAFITMHNRIKRSIENRTNMLSGVSHDLRTILTRMRLELELMNLDKRNKSSLLSDMIEMEKMLNGYLNYARGIYIEEKKYLDIITIINNLIRKFSTKSKIEFNVICHKKQNCEHLFVNIGEQSINRILSNVLDNACKYGNGKVRILLTFDNNNFTIQIEDNGNGISYNKYDDVFKPFIKINEKSDGSGLGLAIVRELVLMNGGSINLDKSEKLKGLKVIINLPI